MGRPRIIAESADDDLRALLVWVYAQLDQSGVTYEQLAEGLSYDRSWVSRSLSGRRLPPWSLVQAVAVRCSSSQTEGRRLWDAANTARLEKKEKAAEGYPPDVLVGYPEFRNALDGLIKKRGLSHRELVRRDVSGRLRRSTIGAALRGERSMSYELLDALVTACGLRSQPSAAWKSAWSQCAEPFRDAMERRRRELAYLRLRGAAPIRRTGRW